MHASPSSLSDISISVRRGKYNRGRDIARHYLFETHRESINLVELALGVFPNGLADYKLPSEHQA
jgi:hypothetical protein